MTVTATTTSASVDRFLAAVTAGDGIPADLYGTDAVADLTVPNWRFRVKGGSAIASEYAGWFANEGRLEEIERHVIDGGELVTYLLVWEENGVPHAAHHCHVLLVDDDGRITRDKVFCGGRWNAGLLAEMAAASDAG